MKKYKRNICILIYIIISLILLASQISINVFRNLDEKFLIEYERNKFITQKKLSNVDDILHLNGMIANYIINDDSLPTNFKQSKNADVIDYLEYDEQLNMFHLDSLVETEKDLSEVSNIFGRGNLEFLNNEDNLKTKEVYMSSLLNKPFALMSDMIESSYWVYYVGLDGILSIRTPEGFMLSDEYRLNEKVSTFELVVNSTMEKNLDTHKVSWGGPYENGAVDDVSVITASYPVDYDGEYIGSINVDVRLDNLTKNLNNDYGVYIANETGYVIINNVERGEIGYSIEKYEDLGYGMELSELLNLEDEVIHKINDYEVISYAIEGTPYTLFQTYASRQHLIDAMYKIMPVAIIILLFAISGVYYIKAKLFKERENKLSYIASYDPLTGILNRRGLHKKIDEIGEDSLQNKASLIVLDIDYFKQVNDKYGHNAGDEVLKNIAKIISDCVSEDDLVARFGGEEFIVLARLNIDEMLELAEKIRFAVEKYKFHIKRKVTVSIGVIEYRKGDARLTTFEKADRALYTAKESGRNRIFYYDQELNNIVQYTNENK